MRSSVIVALLAVRALPCFALEPETDDRAALAAALARTGVEADDLGLPSPTGASPLAAELAADPLSLHGRAAALTGELATADPLGALRWSWAVLGHDPLAGPPGGKEEASLRSRVTSRRDRRVARRLDPRVAEVAARFDALAGEAAALGLDPAWADALLRTLAEPSPTAGPEVPIGALPGASSPALGDALAGLSLRALEVLLGAAETLPREAEAWPEEATVLETGTGRIWIGSPGPDLFAGPYWAVLDPGGDDLHLGVGEAPPLTLVLELAGNDSYRAPAGALAGLVLMADLAGDDDYRGGEGALGGGIGGCGVLWDASGDDRYRTSGWGLGAGVAGVGLLLDGAGSDGYRGLGPAQGVGGPGGVGLLVDRSGDDTYDAGTAAERHGAQGYGFGIPGTAGGLGALVDGAGDDRYLAGDDAQGVGTRGGLGLALDGGGDDDWSARSWAQGAARAGGLGALVDAGGDDRYRAERSAQGRAHDRSAAWLVDRGGDDRYDCLGEGQGSATGNGFALLDDGAGDDAYRVVEPGARWGHAAPLRGRASVALLLDRGGSDGFGPGTEMGDARALVSGLHGLALDLPGGPEPLGGSIRYAALLRGPTADEVDGLLDQAVGWPQDPEAAADAVARLAMAGPGIYPVIRSRLDPEEPAVVTGLGRVIDGLLARDTAWQAELADRIEADLASPGPDTEVLLVWWARAAGRERDPGPALALLEHPLGPVRKAAAAVLEGVGGAPAREALIDRLRDDGDPLVRAAAARSLGACGSGDGVAPLAAALEDPALAVRDGAAGSLVQLGRTGERSSVVEAVRPLASNGVVPALWVLAHLPDSRFVGELERLLNDPLPGVRGQAALALGAIRGSTARKALLGREAVEGDPFVLWCLDRALRTPGNPASVALPLE